MPPLQNWLPSSDCIQASLAYCFISRLQHLRSELLSLLSLLLADISLCDNSITIGPVAVMSLLTGQIITEVHKEHPHLIPNEIASSLAVLCGAFVFVLGILRLGYVFILIVRVWWQLHLTSRV